MKLKKKEAVSETVSHFMTRLIHPLKSEIEELRSIIKNTDRRIQERIKWSALSYHVNSHDFLTFNPRSLKHIHLVFHDPQL